MRISVTKSDPGYFEGAHRCTAYLDGVKLDNCLTADEEQGLALCYDMSDEGRQYARMSGEVRLIELRGEVEINTRDEDGVCILCGVSGAVMHHDDCPRAKEWNHLNLAGCTTEAQARRLGAFVAATEREWKPGDSPVLPETEPNAYVTADELKRFMRECFSADIAAPAPWVEDWLPLGRGGQRRFFNTLDEYMAARVVWIRMSTREREAHLTARDGCTHKLTEIGRLMSRRRKLIAKAKRASPDDAAVGSAIAAMNKPGRAHEL
jgi:hypothetical protein